MKRKINSVFGSTSLLVFSKSSFVDSSPFLMTDSNVTEPVKELSLFKTL
jgi:hypothetical protein